MLHPESTKIMNKLNLFSNQIIKADSVDELDLLALKLKWTLMDYLSSNSSSRELIQLNTIITFIMQTRCPLNYVPPNVKDYLEFVSEYQLIESYADHPAQNLIGDTVIERLPAPSQLTKKKVLSAKIASLEPQVSVSKPMKKDFGYALVDLDGKFIWADDISHKLYETKDSKIQTINFFDLMIPPCQAHLEKKFGNNILFGNELKDHKSIIFSYVIYSQQNMSKVIKMVKKKKSNKNFSLEDFLQNDPNDEMKLYYQYLKALATKATVISLGFKTTCLKDIICPNKYTVSLTEQNKSDFAGDITPSDEISKIISQKSEEMPQRMTRHAIMLQTRLAGKIPKYNYSLMNSDKKIQQMRDQLRSAVKK